MGALFIRSKSHIINSPILLLLLLRLRVLASSSAEHGIPSAPRAESRPRISLQRQPSESCGPQTHHQDALSLNLAIRVQETTYDASALFVEGTLPEEFNVDRLHTTQIPEAPPELLSTSLFQSEATICTAVSHEQVTNDRGPLIEKLLDDRVRKSNLGRPRLLVKLRYSGAAPRQSSSPPTRLPAFHVCLRHNSAR